MTFLTYFLLNKIKHVRLGVALFNINSRNCNNKIAFKPAKSEGNAIMQFCFKANRQMRKKKSNHH